MQYRHIPLSTLLSTVLKPLSLGLLTMLMIMVLTLNLFILDDYKAQFMLTTNELTTTEAIVDKVNDTNVTWEEDDVLEVHYHFNDAFGQRNSGYSYTTSKLYRKGQTVIVEYIVTKTQYSRLKGASFSPLPVWTMAPIFLVIFVIPIFTGIKTLWQTIKTISQLKTGIKVDAEVAQMEEYDEHRFEICYQYQANGSNYRHFAKLARQKSPEVGSIEPLLYSPDNPQKAVSVRELKYLYNIEFDQFSEVKAASALLPLWHIFKIAAVGYALIYVVNNFQSGSEVIDALFGLVHQVQSML